MLAIEDLPTPDPPINIRDSFTEFSFDNKNVYAMVFAVGINTCKSFVGVIERTWLFHEEKL